MFSALLNAVCTSVTTHLQILFCLSVEQYLFSPLWQQSEQRERMCSGRLGEM